MIRTIFVSVFLSLYILLVGPPLLLYTLLSRDPDPIYDAGIGGVMFFVRLAGVRVRVTGTERIRRSLVFSPRTTPARWMRLRWSERSRGASPFC